MRHVWDVTQHYTFLWELIFCLIHSVQTPENTPSNIIASDSALTQQPKCLHISKAWTTSKKIVSTQNYGLGNMLDSYLALIILNS